MLVFTKVIIGFLVCVCQGWQVVIPKGSGPRATFKLRAFEQGPDGSFSDSSDVKEVLDKIFNALKPAVGRVADGATEADVVDSLTLQDVEDKFNKILADIKSSSSLTEMEKRLMFAETTLTLEDTKEKDSNAFLYPGGSSRRLQSTESTFKTSIYSQAVSPVVLVCGPGPVGQKLLELGKSLGKSATFRFLDAEQISVLQEAEIVYAVKDARAVVIAADSKGDSQGRPLVMDEKSVKRLLNIVMSERNKSASRTPRFNVKIVALAQATKQPKSFMTSLMGGGDATDFDSEVILQCQKRQLAYAIVKAGGILADSAPAPDASKVKSRSVKATASPLSNEEEQVASLLPATPVVFTSSRVDVTEYTRTSVAVEALLRSAAHPQTNSSISVLSADNLDRAPTDLEWDDEFLRIEGPELERIPLRFSSEMQIVIRVGRIAKQLVEPGSGLITPIEVERFSNGIRILFRPRASNYLSSKEERKRETEALQTQAATKKPSKSGYLSPEIEEKEAASDAAGGAVTAPAKSSPVNALEGGLEIIVDSKPYRRVRIRRCNMGPQTIVKEESEAIILKAILRGISSLEMDYRRLLVGQ